MSYDPIYLDHNATTPVAPEVLDAMLAYLRRDYGNPSSEHVLGHRAREAVERGRHQVASLIGALPEEIVFTSGGTESNNIAIFGTAARSTPERRRIITSRVEHPAVEGPCARLESSGWKVTRIPVTDVGVVDAVAIDEALGHDVALLTVMLVQNETGVIMPISAISAAARRFGIVTHTDAAQGLGKIAVDVNALGVDLLSIAGHKFYGPKGVGALFVRAITPLEPVLIGASQERGLRPGTENVAGIVGLGAACELARTRLSTSTSIVEALREKLWQDLSGEIPELIRHTPMMGSVPNTLLVSFPDVFGSDVLSLAPGLCASTGSACHAGERTPSSTLVAMGVAPDVATGVVRLSLGADTSLNDIENAARMLVAAFREVQR